MASLDSSLGKLIPGDEREELDQDTDSIQRPPLSALDTPQNVFLFCLTEQNCSSSGCASSHGKEVQFNPSLHKV